MSSLVNLYYFALFGKQAEEIKSKLKLNDIGLHFEHMILANFLHFSLFAKVDDSARMEVLAAEVVVSAGDRCLLGEVCQEIQVDLAVVFLQRVDVWREVPLGVQNRGCAPNVCLPFDLQARKSGHQRLHEERQEVHVDRALESIVYSIIVRLSDEVVHRGLQLRYRLLDLDLRELAQLLDEDVDRVLVHLLVVLRVPPHLLALHVGLRHDDVLQPLAVTVLVRCSYYIFEVLREIEKEVLQVSLRDVLPHKVDHLGYPFLLPEISLPIAFFSSLGHRIGWLADTPLSKSSKVFQ